MSDVSLHQRELETVLDTALDRHESAPHGSLHYAQVCMEYDAADWSAVAEFPALTAIAT
jgi:hypothetical protein